MSQTKVVEKLETCTSRSISFFFNHVVYDNLEKYRMAELATDDNMVNARCVLDN